MKRYVAYLTKKTHHGVLHHGLGDWLDIGPCTPYSPVSYTHLAVWQGVGWGSIIYLSALSNIDTSLYDVANLDGANRLQKIRHIAWPTIMPTSATLLIMNAGSVMNADFQKILLMQNTTNTSKLEDVYKRQTFDNNPYS